MKNDKVALRAQLSPGSVSAIQLRPKRVLINYERLSSCSAPVGMSRL